MRRSRDNEVFSLSFLDVITCGFGAMVLLLLVTKPAPTAPGETDGVGVMFTELFRTEAAVDQLDATLSQLLHTAADQQQSAAATAAAVAAAAAQLQAGREALARLQKEQRALEAAAAAAARQTVASLQKDDPVPDVEVGGIPVDSDHVIFIIDTSGSMQGIWPRVMAELENILDIHPQVSGFQILNDNGQYLIQAYRRRWIPDTPRRRASVLGALRTWRPYSNSSPVEGLEVALRGYAKAGQDVSIYLFGDDYTGANYDSVIRTLDGLNTDPISGAPRVRIHAVGFLSKGTTDRFAVLMREVTRRHNGAFLALPR